MTAPHPQPNGAVRATYRSVVLLVEDIDRSRTFYVELMGLPVLTDMGTNLVLRNGVTLWQVTPGHIIPRTIGTERLHGGSNRFELYFETENLIEALAALESAGAPFLHRTHEEPWGQRTIRVFDPDGNIVEVGETMRTFLSRMRDGGMNAEEIAAKAGMTVTDVRSFIS